jgi:peptide/nickel transport system ATP-binding protein
MLETIPDIEMTGKQRKPMAGEIPNPIDPPPGCAFHPRCPLAEDLCLRESPNLLKKKDDHWVACHVTGRN